MTTKLALGHIFLGIGIVFFLIFTMTVAWKFKRVRTFVKTRHTRFIEKLHSNKVNAENKETVMEIQYLGMKERENYQELEIKNRRTSLESISSIKLSTEVWQNDKYDTFNKINKIKKNLIMYNDDLKTSIRSLEDLEFDVLVGKVVRVGIKHVIGKVKSKANKLKLNKLSTVKRETEANIIKRRKDIEENTNLLKELEIKLDNYKQIVRDAPVMVSLKTDTAASHSTEDLTLEIRKENIRIRVAQIDEVMSEITQIRANRVIIQKYVENLNTILENPLTKKGQQPNLLALQKEITGYDVHLFELQQDIKYFNNFIKKIKNNAREKISKFTESYTELNSQLIKLEEEFKAIFNTGTKSRIEEIRKECDELFEKQVVLKLNIDDENSLIDIMTV